MRSPLVSILIPCYNAEQWIEETINSALKQTYENKEVIVIDDGSTDGSWDIIRKFENNIYSFQTENRGGGVTRNHLLGISKGEWVQYLDADDYLNPNKIADQISFTEQYPGADILYSSFTLESRWNNEVIMKYMPVPEQRDPWILLVKWNLPQIGAVLFRREALIDIGGWKEDQPCCQEFELYIRLLKAGKHFRYTDCSGAVYRKWSKDSVCEKDRMETYRQRLQVIDGAESYLSDTNEISETRQNEINQARFDCARIIWNFDPVWACTVIEKIHNSQAAFVPHRSSTPKIYRLIYKLLGFSAAENIAKLKRNLYSSRRV